MNNFCAKHSQFYSEYCVYCGDPLTAISTTASTTKVSIKASATSGLSSPLSCEHNFFEIEYHPEGHNYQCSKCLFLIKK